MTSTALELLIGKVLSTIENEAPLIGEVRDELRQLELELTSMKSFLNDADDRKVAQTEGEKTWVAQVRDMSHKAEDIIDEFMYQVNKQQSCGGDGGGDGKFILRLRGVVYFPKNLWVKHQTAKKLQNINKMIRAIPERSQRYGVDRIGASGSQSHDHDHQSQRKKNSGESSLFIKDEDLVGIEDGRKQLLGWLMDEEEPQRTVISVVGMGGSGKTTLVANTYNSQIVKRRFDCYAWITISQTYVVDDLLRSMIKEFYRDAKEAIPSDLSSCSYRELLEKILNYLDKKRYVVVLDDLWTNNVWRDISVSFPDHGLGSRIILTTRKEDIAFGYVHRIKPLSTGDAWNLFCMKVFLGNRSRSCPQGFKTLGENLVAKCEGLPLAIVALGGILSSKHLESDWRKIYNSLSWELNNHPGLEVVKSILLLSFNDLPYRLKCCFLYCCLFPEDYQIERRRLIRLWMAEGFVEKVKGRTPEEEAEDYLMELIHRNMLQVVERDGEGKPRKCKMHDLLRELSLSKLETEKFCAIANYDGGEANENEREARRLSIQFVGRSSKSSLLQSRKGMSQLRSLLVFAKGNISPTLETLPQGLRLLTLLDLEDVPIENLPDELVDLFNLRYLNLRNTRVKKLPESIGRLGNLQTLDIRNSQIKELPAGITKLEKLRHLSMFRINYGNEDSFEWIYGTPVPSDICKLKNLQSLGYVEAKEDLMKRVRNMTQVKSIGFSKVKEADEEDLCIAIQNMSLLHYLSVMVTNEDECLRMDALSSAPPCLKRLELAGKLEKVPGWFHSLQSLTYLNLHWSRLAEDDDNWLPYIQALPNLGKLILENACEGRRLCFTTGFHKLRELFLRNFPLLEEIIIESGVMPGLQLFYIGKCMQLKMLPDGIRYLRKLEELRLRFLSNELVESINGEAGRDNPTIRHIPRVTYRGG